MALLRSRVSVSPQISVIVSLVLALCIWMIPSKAQASPLVSSSLAYRSTSVHLSAIASPSTIAYLSSITNTSTIAYASAIADPLTIAQASTRSPQSSDRASSALPPQSTFIPGGTLAEALPSTAMEDMTDKVRIDGSNEMNIINQTLKNRFEADFPEVDVAIQANGTEAALDALLKDEIDLAAICRALTDEGIS